MEISTNQAINDVLQAKASATNQKMALAVANKQLDAQKLQGQALVDMLSHTAKVQKQLAAGHIDVRV
jgi:hypothetical protein